MNNLNGILSFLKRGGDDKEKQAKTAEKSARSGMLLNKYRNPETGEEWIEDDAWQKEWDFPRDVYPQEDPDVDEGIETRAMLPPMSENNSKRPGAGGDGVGESLISPVLPAMNLAKRLLTPKIGEFASNVKAPVGYEVPKAGNIPQAFMNLLKGKDEPVFEHGVNDPQTQARDFILRKSLQMDDNAANRMGGKDAFIDEGNDNLAINTLNPIGKKMQKGIDLNAKQMDEHKMNTAMYDHDAPTFKGVDRSGKEFVMPQTTYPFAMYDKTLMNNYNMEQLGEGTDENGYYVKYGGEDPWDFALHPEENMINLGQGSFSGNVKKTGSNIMRTLLDGLLSKKNIKYESKVYKPEIKQQPRKKEVRGYGSFIAE